jgi:hypothetical protein
MVMTKTIANEIFRSFLHPVQESVLNGTIDAEQLYSDLCITVRMESDLESDAKCEAIADDIYVRLTGYIPAKFRAQLNIPR